MPKKFVNLLVNLTDVSLKLDWPLSSLSISQKEIKVTTKLLNWKMETVPQKMIRSPETHGLLFQDIKQVFLSSHCYQNLSYS